MDSQHGHGCTKGVRRLAISLISAFALMLSTVVVTLVATGTNGADGRIATTTISEVKYTSETTSAVETTSRTTSTVVVDTVATTTTNTKTTTTTVETTTTVVTSTVKETVVGDVKDVAIAEMEATVEVVNPAPSGNNHITPQSGTFEGPSGHETYYNLHMSGVVEIMRGYGYSEEEYPYWEREDGAKMFGDYVMVAADLKIRPKGTILETSLGTAIVCDTGGFASGSEPTYHVDIAVTW